MSLSLSDQYDTAVSAWTQGDFDLMGRVLTDPSSIGFNEQKTFAQQLGLKKGLLSYAVNVVSDPLVIAAFFLQRRFPFSQYIKGSIPSRFIGSANEFTGLSSIGRTVEGFFRGTNIPKLSSLIMKRQTEVMSVGNKYFDEIAARPAWATEMPLVSQILEGQRPNAPPELYAVASRARSHLNELWGFLNRTHKVEGGLFESTALQRASARPFTAQEAPRYLRDYLPHIPLTVEESTMAISGREAVQRLARGPTSAYFRTANIKPQDVWRPTRTGGLQSSYFDFQRMMETTQAQVFNPRLFRRVRMGVPLQSTEGAGLFITDLDIIMQKYVHSVSKTYALNAPVTSAERRLMQTFTERGALSPSLDPPIVQVINEGLDAAGPVRLSQRLVKGTNVTESIVDQSTLNRPTLGALRNLTKDLMGKSSDDEILFGNIFSAIRNKSKGLLTGKRAVQLDDALNTMEREKDRKMMGRITSYFYSTTLGLNPSSALKNLFQPFLTTVPAIGLGPTLKGYGVLKQRLPRYFQSFNHERRLLEANRTFSTIERLNLAQERAFIRTFPELAATGIKADPRRFELSEAALIIDKGKGKFRTYDEYAKFMLQPFTQTELSNQIVTFYGGKNAIRNAMLRGEITPPAGRPLGPSEIDDYLNFEAASLVNATQFRPGPGSRTPLQSLIPGPFRMFTSFPVRLGNFFAESTVRGALTDKQLEQAGKFTKAFGGRNWGTLARTFILGKVVSEGLKETLGVDMGDAVGLMGPYTNVLHSGRMFAPLPLAPLPSALVGIASFTSSRDLKDLQPLTLPGIGDIPIPRSLVPGGVAITRAVRAVRAYRPDLGGFVDDEERLMMRADASDAVLAMMGVPLDKERRMREAIERMNDVRLRQRQFRREFAVARRNGDFTTQSQLQTQWKTTFPDFPPLVIASRDQRRYDEQARMTAAQRMVRSMGRGASFLEGALYEVDPDLVAGQPLGLPQP